VGLGHDDSVMADLSDTAHRAAATAVSA